MQFEVIRKSHKKEILVGVIVFILISIVLIVHQSFAKYQATKNMKIAEGTINYKIPDFKIMAMYQQKTGTTCTTDSCYTEVTTMPNSLYKINESKSYCSIDNVNKDNNARLFTTEEGIHSFSGLTKNDKCYIYFDKQTTVDTVLGTLNVNLGIPDFSNVATTDEGVYKAEDDDGDTYYWRGAVKDNYVKFANKFWRIIRINGDGTIRLIYQGTSATSTGIDAQIGTSSFSQADSNNMYVGFKYTSGDVHGIGTKSIILGVLETWYTNNLASYESKIATNAGFCNDREPSTSTKTSNGSGGTEKIQTYYGAHIRLVTNKTPTLKCKNSSDLFTKTGTSKGNKSLTYPIGLITADEVAMAGGVYGTENSNYYLCTGQKYYWTLSPINYLTIYSNARMFVVNSTGDLGAVRLYSNTVGFVPSVRPVINLRSNVTLTGKGTASDPYVVQ